MDKMTQLWIRACKSKDPSKRLHSVLRRFYLVGGNGTYKLEAIIHHLSVIVDKYISVDSYTLYKELTQEDTFFRDDRTPQEKMLSFMVRTIAFTEVSKLDGLTTPCKFRNKEKTQCHQ